MYEEILRVGATFELAHAGYHAMNACRVEKGYRHFGDDIGDEITPYSAGLGFAVDMSKANFIGKSALKDISNKYAEKLVNIAIKHEDPPLLYHDEPVYAGDELVGISTSGMWGHRINRSLGIALLKHDEGVTKKWLASKQFEIEVAGIRYPLDVQLSAFYDPEGRQLKG